MGKQCDVARANRTRVSLGAAAAIASAAFFAFAPTASTDVGLPTVTAGHAFIGDPLFGLNTSGGTLFGILPDERTAMASTTKLMTLDVTLDAVDDGVVSLHDQVTVDPFAASIDGSPCPPNCNSVMTDIDGVELEAGEVVSLETLIRGMMYPSGNDAAWAIAYHVAQAYGNDLNGDGVVDGNDFVVMMNQHAAAIGLEDTNFTSPNGWDDPTTANPAPGDLNHYTTARELSMIIDHGLNAHAHFGEVIGFKGTYTDTSQGPNGPKTYSFCWGCPVGSTYPGWEGQKGGSTQNCNGLPGRFCLAISAKRVGRRVVASFMQGVGGSQVAGMLDYGFARIFHPDPRGSSASVGAAIRHDTMCSSSSRCASVVLPASGDVKLVSWQPDIDGSSIGILDQESLPGSGLPPKGGKGVGPSGDVALAEFPSGAIVAANRKGSSAELSRWSLDAGGTLSLLASGVKLGPAATMDLQPVYASMFLAATIDPEGVLVLTSWKLDGSTLVKLDTYRDESRAYSEVSIAGPLATDVFNGHRAVTAAVAAGVLVHDAWGVDPASGEISRLGELAEAAGGWDNVEINSFHVNAASPGELFLPTYYATAFRYSNGIGLRFYRIDAAGTPVDEGAISTLIPVEEIGVAPLGTGGVLSAARQGDGTVELRAWETRRNDDNTISPAQLSLHTAPEAGSLDLVQVPSTHAEGDYATAATDPLTGELRLRAYRSGDRPY
jgi:D-alanyl-D-alanine carboxypeptidase